MSTSRFAPAPFAASTRSRSPCTMMRSKASGLPSRMATRWTTVSQPSTAWRKLSASVMSPWTTSQPQARELTLLLGLAGHHAHGSPLP